MDAEHEHQFDELHGKLQKLGVQIPAKPTSMLLHYTEETLGLAVDKLSISLLPYKVETYFLGIIRLVSIPKEYVPCIPEFFHNNIVAQYGLLVSKNNDYFLMLENTIGTRVQEYLEENTLTEEMDVSWVCDVSHGLHYLHALNFWYGELSLDRMHTHGSDLKLEHPAVCKRYGQGVEQDLQELCKFIKKISTDERLERLSECIESGTIKNAGEVCQYLEGINPRNIYFPRSDFPEDVADVEPMEVYCLEEDDNLDLKNFKKIRPIQKINQYQPNGMDSPRALNIVAVNDGRLEAANLSALQDILLSKRYADMPLAVISVAGAMREGKRYLMNGFVNRQEIGEGWFTADTPMNRFQFKGGSIGCTTGIDIWSKPYVIEKGGKEMVALFMDTQGVFDQDHTTGVQTNIFALSILLSSIQIFNKKNLINGNDLNYLQLFTHMAKAGQTEDNKMFQKLLFLIRDFTEEEGISFNDGEDYKKTIIFKDARNSDTRALQKDIQSSFKEIECCMFPDPGRKFKQMKSQPSDYFGDEEFELFRAAFIRFVEHVMASVEPKQLNGLDMTCREFLALYEKLITYFNSGKAPEAKTLLQAMAETNISSYLQRAKNEYDTLMNSPEAKNPRTFLEANNAARTAAENFFGQCKAMGSEQLLEQSGNDLMEYMTIQFDEIRTEMQRDIDAATTENILIYIRNQLNSCHLRNLAGLKTVLENIVKTTKEIFDGRTIVADSVLNYNELRGKIMREIDAKTAIVAALERVDQQAEAARIEKAQLLERQKQQEDMYKLKLANDIAWEKSQDADKHKTDLEEQNAAKRRKASLLAQIFGTNN